MKNRDIYQKDPAIQKLVNQGVASVNDDKTTQALSVLRYELETFVCEGQYEKGTAHILETCLKNIDQAEQPAVWVSGFYGSGKSHLIKMLRALWADTVFEDGATARGIANLPKNIRDLLMELTVQAKRHGGLHAASGTLGSGASGSVRLALLRIIFKSADLPEHYPVASFVLWLKAQGIYDRVKSHVEHNKFVWEEELDNFHVAEGLYDALCQIKPKIFSPNLSAAEILPQLYPNVSDISNDDMLKAIRQALIKNGKFPLTLIVLDEVQQYIGEESRRSIEVQEVVEACSKNIGGKLLFIGSGQTALSGTSNLKKLEGRFTIRIELSDSDVDGVVRKIILAKKPEALLPIEQIMGNNLGEISRHLAGTSLGHRQTDIPYFPQDYPLLPVRRRFWEQTLRVLDQTGTDSQLRNQLSMVHKAIQTNLDEPLGNIIPADHLYFDSAEKLLQTRILPRKVHEKTMSWITGTEEEKLMARACALVFLINKLGGCNNETGIRATLDALADLLIENITSGSSRLRSKLPGLLEKCELLMKVGDEYRIQTEESSAWNDEFLSQKSTLVNEAHRIDAERDDRIRHTFAEIANKLSLVHGQSKVTRNITPLFDSRLPTDANRKIYLWVRDGWSTDESSLRTDARQAGNQSATIFTFIPKRNADDLRHQLIEYKAATATLEKRGEPDTPEGREACEAMKTIRQTAEGRIRELLGEAFSGARVFQGGGHEIQGNNIKEMVLEAANNSLQRLYPQFESADHSNWPKVYEKARSGAPDALKSVADDGEVSKNPVCKTILGFIAGGKKGIEIRDHFEESPYGWSRDAVDGGLQVLLVAGLIRAEEERGLVVESRDLERKAIGKVTFKVESATISSAQRIQIRKLLQKVSLNAKQGEELHSIPQFLRKMMTLADESGGEAPKPLRPDTSFLDEIRLTAGNEQLLTIYNNREKLAQMIDAWSSTGKRINQRWQNWVTLKHLMVYAERIEDAQMIQIQVLTIEQQRQLLEEPDLIIPLVANLTQLLRAELNSLKSAWEEQWQAGEVKLEQDYNWLQLEPEQRYSLRLKQQLVDTAKPAIAVSDTISILNSLEKNTISSLYDRIAAMPGRFERVLLGAARLMEPEVQEVALPSQTLKSEKEIDAWLAVARKVLLEKLKNGPVMPQ